MAMGQEIVTLLHQIYWLLIMLMLLIIVISSGFAMVAWAIGTSILRLESKRCVLVTDEVLGALRSTPGRSSGCADEAREEA